MDPVIRLSPSLIAILRDEGEVVLVGGRWHGVAVGASCTIFIEGAPVTCVRTKDGARLRSLRPTVNITHNNQLALVKNGRVRLAYGNIVNINVGDACAANVKGLLVDCVRTDEGLRLKDFTQKDLNMTLYEAIATARTCLHAAQGCKITSEVDRELLTDANMDLAYDVLMRWHSLLDGHGVVRLKSFRSDVTPNSTPVSLHEAIRTARAALCAGQGKITCDGLATNTLTGAYDTLQAWHDALESTGTQILRSFSQSNDLRDEDS